MMMMIVTIIVIIIIIIIIIISYLWYVAKCTVLLKLTMLNNTNEYLDEGIRPVKVKVHSSDLCGGLCVYYMCLTDQCFVDWDVVLM